MRFLTKSLLCVFRLVSVCVQHGRVYIGGGLNYHHLGAKKGYPPWTVLYRNDSESIS